MKIGHQSPYMARKSNKNRSICEECGNKFSSKKALGVHMRVHLNFLKKPPKMIEDGDVSEIGDRKITRTSCKLCGKRFWSLRSLCGHMRCHPEKERRGMRPSEEIIKSGGFENMNQSSYSYESELDDDVYGAACALMLIATGEERYKLCPKNKKEESMSSKKRKRNVIFIKTTMTLSHVGKVCGKEAKRVVVDVDLNELPPEYGDGDQPTLA